MQGNPYLIVVKRKIFFPCSSVKSQKYIDPIESWVASGTTVIVNWLFFLLYELHGLSCILNRTSVWSLSKGDLISQLKIKHMGKCETRKGNCNLRKRDRCECYQFVRGKHFRCRKRHRDKKKISRCLSVWKIICKHTKIDLILSCFQHLLVFGNFIWYLMFCPYS